MGNKKNQQQKKKQKNKMKNNQNKINKCKDKANFNPCDVDKNRKKKNKEKKIKNKYSSNEYKKKFDEQMDALGLRILEVGGDGNCFFRSVCDQLEGSENNHSYYRELACNYIEQNKDFIKFFIEDDQNIDNYIHNMRKNGIWGGNIEIYSLSMALNVNFYIFLLERPLYIVKNHDFPKRNLFLSYHEGQHYNTVRLKDDFSNGETPKEIDLTLLTGVPQDSNPDNINEISDEESSDSENNENNEEEDKNDDKDNNDNEEKNDENLDINKIDDENEKENEIKNQQKLTYADYNKNKHEIFYKGIKIADIDLLTSSDIDCLQEKILNDEGIIYTELKKKQKKNDKNEYKKYYPNEDIRGNFDEDKVIFYCKIYEFFEKIKEGFEFQPKEIVKMVKNKSKNNNNNDVNKEIENVTKKIELIYI